MSEERNYDGEAREELNSAEQAQPTGQAGQAEQAGQQPSELLRELQELGQQLDAAFRAAFKAIQPTAGELEQRARKAAQQVQEGRLVREVESVLISGLHQINDRLRNVVERLEERRSEREAAEAQTTQRLHIEQESSGEMPQSGAGELPPHSPIH